MKAILTLQITIDEELAREKNIDPKDIVTKYLVTPPDDVVDGYLITTAVPNCNNLEDFFIKDIKVVAAIPTQYEKKEDTNDKT